MARANVCSSRIRRNHTSLDHEQPPNASSSRHTHLVVSDLEELLVENLLPNHAHGRSVLRWGWRVAFNGYEFPHRRVWGRDEEIIVHAEHHSREKNALQVQTQPVRARLMGGRSEITAAFRNGERENPCNPCVLLLLYRFYLLLASQDSRCSNHDVPSTVLSAVSS